MLIERQGGVAVVRLRGGKANAMSRELLAGLARLMDGLGDAGAVVITGYERFFSAGLALPELIDLSREELATFMGEFQIAMLSVFRCPRPVIAAVNGHAIAGGCVLALMADVRLMAEGEHKIGLNEVALGIGLPPVVIEPLRLQLPASSWPAVALEGRLVTPPEARQLGLVDEVVAAERLEAVAIERAERLSRLSTQAHGQIKLALRGPALEAISATYAVESERWLDTWFSPPAQATLRAAIARLGAGK
jgi:enoyl-CoA hydratase